MDASRSESVDLKPSECNSSSPLVVVEFQVEKNIFIIKMMNNENRFNEEFIKAFHRALDTVETRWATLDLPKKGKVALMTLSEGKFYSNGLDLASILKLTPGDVPKKEKNFGILQQFLETHFLPLLGRLLAFPMPTVALLNGHAFAGGFLLALAHDYRVMCREHGYLCMNELQIGLTLHPGMHVLLRQKITNSTVLRDTLLFCKRWNAQEARNTQMIDVIVELERDLVSSGSVFIASKQALGLAGPVYNEMKCIMYEKSLKSLHSFGVSKSKL